MPRARWSRPLLVIFLLLALLSVSLAPHQLSAQGRGGGQPGSDGAPISGSPAVPRIKTAPLPQVAMPSPSDSANAPAAAPASMAPGLKSVVANASTAATTAAAVVDPTLDMRVLVISADGKEDGLPAIRQTLDYLGVPYTLWVGAQHAGTITADQLFSGSHGFYYAVMLTTSNLAYDNNGSWQSGLDAAGWQTLWDYEAAFGVRQVTWYTFPTADYGFSSYTAADTTNTALNASLTTAGRQVFPYLSTSAIPIRYAYTYRGVAAAGTQVLVRDPSGRALALVKAYPDGRENLAVTFAGNPYLVHTMAYSYGLVNWATRGIFLGQRQIYMTPQADDYFIDDDVWTASTPCGTNLDLYPSGVTFRMSRTDLQAIYRWQTARRAQSITKGLQISMAFNGIGAVPESADGDMPANDTLISATNSYKSYFYWINHTYEHLLLEDQQIPAAEFQRQLELNHNVATQLKLPNYDKGNIVTPEISGLSNPNFLAVAAQFGIKYLVSDVSRAGMANPSPNVGYPNQYQSGIYTIPRRANNLFYNVTQPSEWVAEYNCLYESFWGSKLTYSQIIDKESDMLLQYLLRGDIDPWMFHVTNMRNYQSGTNKTLLGDLIDATVTKYQKVYNLPISSLSQETIGQMMKDRAAYNSAGVIGTISGKQITLTATSAATVPVTGACYSNSSQGISQKSYGGQCIATVPVTSGGQVSFTLP